jgi:hypothetical protein
MPTDGLGAKAVEGYNRVDNIRQVDMQYFLPNSTHYLDPNNVPSDHYD